MVHTNTHTQHWCMLRWSFHLISVLLICLKLVEGLLRVHFGLCLVPWLLWSRKSLRLGKLIHICMLQLVLFVPLLLLQLLGCSCFLLGFITIVLLLQALGYVATCLFNLFLCQLLQRLTLFHYLVLTLVGVIRRRHCHLVRLDGARVIHAHIKALLSDSWSGQVSQLRILLHHFLWLKFVLLAESL